MKKVYFAMMYSQDGETAMPIIDSEDEDGERVKFWETEEEARESMKNHYFAKSFGYEIFSMDEGL